MTGAQGLVAGILLLTLALQAALPSLRLVVALGGACLSCLAVVALRLGTVGQLFASVPWDVLLILVALGVYAELLASTRLFSVMAVHATRMGQARPGRLLVLFAVGTYAISGLVNNLTALMMVLPVLLGVCKLLGVSQRYASWLFGVILVACNLGGAATPIGDFPAVLLLGRGAMGFGSYLAGAVPATAVALGILLAVVGLAVRPARDVEEHPITRRLTLATLGQLYRRTRLEVRVLAPALAALAAMMGAWLGLPASWGVGPELVCWVGAGAALLSAPRRAEQMLRKVDAEAGLFLLALFLMVGAVRQSGFFVVVARGLLALPLGSGAKVMVFLGLAAVLTGLFSAGPSMAALLDVAVELAQGDLREPVFLGLALAVCAGSSLFLTAATSGPLTQALVERSELKSPGGAPVRFGFREFLPVGLVGFLVILAVALGRTALVLPS